MPAYFDDALAKIKVFEGCVPWMYRDTVGKVTVGVGLMLPNAAAACALPFLLQDVPANAAQIAAEYARVDGLAEGRLPGFYKVTGSLELAQETIDAKLASVLEGFEDRLRAGITGYGALPHPAKMALLDMAYNLGPAGLLSGYPRLIKFVEAGEWTKAAADCGRRGPGAERNAWTRQQFLDAGSIATIKAEAEPQRPWGTRWLWRLLGRQ